MEGKWREITLGDFVALQRGHDLPEPERRSGRVPIMGSAGQNGYHDTALAKGPGIVIGRSGASFGQVHYSPVDYWPHNTALYVTDFKGNDPRFAFYFLKAIDFDRFNSGSAQPSLNRNFIYPIPVRVPPPSEQRAISAVLGTLDDKIELNRRMNATLEAMARALFKSWFVDFDPVRAKAEGRRPVGLDPATAALFPATFEDSSPLGPTPYGWRPATLELIATVSSGKRPTDRGGVFGNIPIYGGGGQMGYAASSLYEKPILLTGRVGTLGLIFRIEEPSWPSDNTLVVEPRIGFLNFTYFVLKGFDLVTLNRGSSQPLLTQTDLKRQEFILPPHAIIQAYERFSSPLFQRMTANHKQSRTLAALRDALLPKLLSGEIRVGDAKRKVARAV